ncbi:MAG: hypothetical protein ACTHK0_05790 [Ginsengibacter sp.]
MKHILLIFLTCLAALPVIPLHAQNVTSPYSILGIGDIDTKDFGRYFATGDASLARRDPSAYNFSNPASLTSLPFKVVNFDISMRGRASTFMVPGQDTLSSVTKDFVVKRITLAFRPFAKTAMAFGLKPFSSVNYQYVTNKAILDGNNYYTKNIDGSGGINQMYFSVARSLSKRISAGVTASWLFGSLINTTSYTGNTLNVGITRTETNFYKGGLFQAGLQYYTLSDKKWQHKIGLTFSAGTNLAGQLTTDYSENDTIKVTNILNDQNFKLPVTIGFGYAATSPNGLTFSADVNYYDWPYQSVNYENSFTNPSIRASAGMEYSKKATSMNGTYEKYYLGLGASIENSYIRINNNYLWDYSFSVGGGYNISRAISVYGGFEAGKKGNESLGQIKENYNQFVIGFSLKDIWIGPKIGKRYN